MGLMNKLRQRLHRLQAKNVDIVKSPPTTSNEITLAPTLYITHETTQSPTPSHSNVSAGDTVLQDIDDAFHHPDVLDIKRRIRVLNIAARFLGAQLFAHPLSNPPSPSPSESSPTTTDAFDTLIVHDAHGGGGGSIVTLVNERVLKMSDFVFLGVLGVGTYSKVFRVRDQVSEKMYALKVIEKAGLTARDEETIMVELEALQRVVGMPGFLQIEASFHDSENYCILTDVVSGGSLDDELWMWREQGIRFPEEKILFYTAELITLIQALHSRGIIHRNIKPANILIDSDGHLVIADFGLAKVFDTHRDPLIAPSGIGYEVDASWMGPYLTNEALGIADYTAPEVFCGQAYSFGVDYWSLGVVLYRLFFDEMPWKGDQPEEVFAKVMNDRFKIPEGANISQRAVELLGMLLALNPSARATPYDVWTYSIFDNVNWDDIAARKITPPHMTLRSKPDSTVIEKTLDVNACTTVGKPYTALNDPLPAYTYTSAFLRQVFLDKESSERLSVIKPKLSSPVAVEEVTADAKCFPSDRRSFSGSLSVDVTPNSPSGDSVVTLTNDRVVQLSDFDFVDVLGLGAYGKVFRARDKMTGKMSALKVIKKISLTKKDEENIMAELEALQRLVGIPGFLQLEASFHDSENYYILTDLVSGGSLDDELWVWTNRGFRFTPEKIRFYAAELIASIKILHSRGIIHRDLKPANILIGNDGHLVIADFGLAKVFPLDYTGLLFAPSGLGFEHPAALKGPYLATEPRGTANYTAPEVFCGENYSFGVDFWSLGVVLFEMIFDEKPWKGDDSDAIFANVLSKDLVIPDSTKASDDVLELLHMLLERKPFNRATPDEIMTHSLFDDIQWDEVAAHKMVPQHTTPQDAPEADTTLDIDLYFTVGKPYDFSNDPLPAYTFTAPSLRQTPITHAPTMGFGSLGSYLDSPIITDQIVANARKLCAITNDERVHNTTKDPADDFASMVAPIVVNFPVSSSDRSTNRHDLGLPGLFGGSPFSKRSSSSSSSVDSCYGCVLRDFTDVHSMRRYPPARGSSDFFGECGHISVVNNGNGSRHQHSVLAIGDNAREILDHHSEFCATDDDDDEVEHRSPSLLPELAEDLTSVGAPAFVKSPASSAEPLGTTIDQHHLTFSVRLFGSPTSSRMSVSTVSSDDHILRNFDAVQSIHTHSPSLEESFNVSLVVSDNASLDSLSATDDEPSAFSLYGGSRLSRACPQYSHSSLSSNKGKWFSWSLPRWFKRLRHIGMK